MSRSRFRQLVKEHPRVCFHSDATACTSLTWSRSSVTAYYDQTEKGDAARERARCRNPAHWRFVALKRSLARDGDFCWSHLLYRGIFGDMIEEAATEAHLERHKPAP